MTQTPPSQEQPTGSKLASMECACPVCGKTVLTISGQTFMYVNDHVLHPGPGGEGTTTLVLSHPGTPTAILPAREMIHRGHCPGSLYSIIIERCMLSSLQTDLSEG